MMLNYRYEVFPTTEQTEKLEQAIHVCRHVYNSALLDRQNHYKQHKKTLSPTTLQKQLALDKQKYPLLKIIHSQPLQETLFRLERAYNNFFAGRAKYPKLKKVKDYHSITYTQFGEELDTFTGRAKRYGAHFREDGSLYLSRIGKVKILLHRSLDGKVKQATIKRKGNRWFAILSVERHADKQKAAPSHGAVGIDVGINKFAVLSNGKEIHNPRFLRQKEKQLKKAQRKLSKMKRGSNNYKKQLLKTQNLHAKVANQRKDFLHKQSFHIAKNYTIVCVEDLNVRNMVRNRKLSKSIQDAGWSMFRNMIEYKCERFANTFIKVSSRFTTQDCSSCGTCVRKSLSVRTHVCPACGTVLDRDLNAAINIKKAGLDALNPVPM